MTPKYLRTVLNAAFYTWDSQTICQVRSILEDLGNDEVTIEEFDGERKPAFEDGLFDRLVQF